ncbi:glycoside hydrolase family 3 C-terminal domain-containing protein [Paenibacillus sp. FSL H8-0537]|uniref:glycoside hydrolase family 3 C-terminal domain-containing protein n=1 Tax=Paenibacillus sp. FSL H8-0537 TaxID=2921399 RepID=UPI00310118FD
MVKLQNGKRLGKRVLSVFTVITITAGLMTQIGPVSYAAETTVVFKTQSGGVFNGMPLFDGNPEHLDDFVDTYFNYTGLEGPAVYVTGSRNHYTLKRGAHAGNVIPGALSAADNVQGISTDFPALVGMGQTWNKELLGEIGKVIGNEKISQLKVKQGESNIHGGANASASVAFTVVSDLRINPLSGRFDEGFAEDAYMAGTLIDKMATGLSGIDQPATNDGFWMRAAVGTKHYSVYNAQWFRQSASNSAGARAMFEYQTKSALKGLESGAVAGVMTSFGRTNGIPNILSPLQLHANEFSKYGVYSSPDFNGDQHVSTGNQLGNGYDNNYAVDRAHATLLMAMAKASAGRPSPSVDNANIDVAELVALVEQNEYGITTEDLIEAARPHVNQLVRLGIFNETDENGIPTMYPFAQDAKDVRQIPAASYKDAEHQEVALNAAQESIVLLKNDGTLPLVKNQNAAVSGIYADSRFKTVYSVGVTPTDIANSGNSPLLSIIKANGANHVHYTNGSEVIALTSKLNGQTIKADVDQPNAMEQGSALIMSAEAVDPQNPAQLFQVYDWGQEGSSLLSLYNNRWVTSPAAGSTAVGNTDGTKLNLTANDWNLAEMVGETSVIPPRLRMESNADDTVSLVANGYRTGFSGDFTNFYYSNGRFVTTGDDASLKTAADPLGTKANAAVRPDAVKFEKTVVQEVGAEAAARADIDDYAVVFVGAVPRHSAGEGNERSSLNMGDADYKLVDKVSSAFAAKGKKTVVVVKTSFPVGLEEIQNNPNVSAIVYQPYGGQYDSYALAQVLYGDYAPTGRLTSTWYKDMSVFPTINKYVIPEGNKTTTLDDIDPRFQLDMTNADPIESELTYMYTKAPVTYSFGYGLSYSSFSYKGLSAPSSVSGNEPFTVSVQVRNDGAVATSEVVQLYVKNNNASYGSHAPQKQLASFEKVYIAPGESRTVELTVDPKDFGIWDVNSNQFIVENGDYTLELGSSSSDIKAQHTVHVQGQSLAQLSLAQPFNVFDHAYAANEVVYHEVSKAHTAAELKEKAVVGGYYAVTSKQNDSWVALPKVSLTGVNKVKASVASDAAGGVITLHADSPSSAPIATITVPQTQMNAYKINNANVQVKELGYTDVEVDVSLDNLTGIHDLYVVFKAPDIRIDSLAFTATAAPTPTTTPTTSTGTSGSGTVVPTPTPTATPTPSAAATPTAVMVAPGSESDAAKVAKISKAGVKVTGEAVAITVSGKQGNYAEATVNAGKQTGQSELTLALVGADGKLTPVPSKATIDQDGNTVIKALVSSSGTYVIVSSTRRFTDVPGSAWFAHNIEKANGLLLINGVSETQMKPAASTTAAQTLMVALNVLGLTPEQKAGDTKWYDAVVRSASDAGLIESAAFQAEKAITRESMAEILTNALAYAGFDTELSASEASALLADFKDAAKLSNDKRNAMAVAVKYGIFKGTPDGRLLGAATLTRAELAAVALRTYEAVTSKL